ncbi:MAG TPA: hypothetical protein VMF10_12965 [Candidatus Aquilonibacter sp.]|nr:hypothetical protein [Candidatus Aquilonibacter sp.]
MDFMFSRLVWLLGASFILLTFSLPSSAKVPHAASLDSDYVSALAAANRFLQAWQSGDGENGIALLTERAKKGMNPGALDKFFSASEPSGYEINRGERVRRGRYEFPVVLVSRVSNKLRREFSSIVIVDTSNNDWAVDKLP